MKNSTIFDYIVVGQGIAGSVLALAMASRGLSVIIINEEKGNTSSKIAAGLLNPITGFKQKKTWLADTIFPVLNQFYLNQEKVLAEEFYFPKNIFIPFDSILTQNEWISKSVDQQWKSYIDPIELPDSYKAKINQPYGGMSIHHGGWVDIPKLLEAAKVYFIRKGNFINNKIDHSKIESDELVTVDGITGKRLIFCEGTNARHNPFFDWIPFIPNKGEILDLKIENYPRDYILNKGVFLIPITNGNFRCGSTYYNDYQEEETITAEAEQEIMSKFRALVKEVDVEIVGQKANVRPSVLGRRPVLGHHPNYPNIGIFNGLGSKGASIAPYFAEVLINHFEHKMPISKEVDCQRFWK